MSKFIDGLNGWLKPKAPETPVGPTPDEPGRTPYLRVWAILRTVNLKELLPIVLSVPSIVFFAISGFIAWVYLILRAIVLFVRNLFK